MTVGEALAEARYHAGLTVDEVSERTRIRESVIRCIEHDDYEACGGDLYVRGYVRAIAGAIGIDAQPLIRQYDAGHAGAVGVRGPFAADPVVVGTAVAATVTDLPAIATDPEYTADPHSSAATSDPTIAHRGPTITDPDFSIGNPDFTMADPDFAIADAEESTVAPDRAAADQDFTVADPERTPVHPDPSIADSGFINADADASTVAPDLGGDQDLAAADPDLAAADPDHTAADPDFAFADPNFTVADQDFTFADQDYAVAAPDATIADLGFTAADPDFTTADPEFNIDDSGLPFPDSWLTPAGAPRTIADPQSFTATSTPAPGTPTTATATAPKAARPSVLRARIRSRRWVAGIAVLVVIALAAAGVAGSHIVSHVRHTLASNNAAQHNSNAQGAQGTRANTSTHPANTSNPAKATTTPSPANTPHPKNLAPIRALPISLAEAFGPDGTADGDNPQIAMSAITPNAQDPWQSDWYTTADFGRLKQGTGLLLDMGETVTITSARIDLSPYRGTYLQLKLGAAPDLSDLRVAAQASDAAGAVQLRLRSPIRARYLLLWFTLLPPNGTGRYQESVYRVVVNGRP